MTIAIGNRRMGDGAPCFVIAEAGSNHNGNIEQARRLIDVAVTAGVDAVKFQLFRAERMYPRSAGVSDYLGDPRPIYDIIDQMAMPYEWLPELRTYCERHGVLFLASVFDEEAADRLDPHVHAFKIASYEMTHAPLVDHVARKGKPVIISTGTATMDEVAEMVDAFRATGNRDLALMQCTAAYPAPLTALNVRTIPAMRARFGVPVGLSDHSRDPLVGVMAAVALGAEVIEKHYTLSNELPGPDHRFAVEPPELALMVRKIREVEQALGTASKQPDAVEAELRAFARRSVFATRAIAKGEPFTPENVAVLRCGKLTPGLAPREYPGLLRRTAARPIAHETAIQADDVA